MTVCTQDVRGGYLVGGTVGAAAADTAGLQRESSLRSGQTKERNLHVFPRPPPSLLQKREGDQLSEYDGHQFYVIT